MKGITHLKLPASEQTVLKMFQKNINLSDSELHLNKEALAYIEYVEDLKCESNTDIGLEDIFEIAYSQNLVAVRIYLGGKPPFHRFNPHNKALR